MTKPEPIFHPALAALQSVKHAFFTRIGGVSEGVYSSLNGGIGSLDDPMKVAENRRRMATFLNVPAGSLVSCWQHHSADCLVVSQPFDPGNRPKADAMVTREKGIALAIGTADCGPVLFADAQAGVVGGAHSGWKGALTGVLETTVKAMEVLGARRDRIVAVLGPMISRNAYEVGPEFVDRFVAASSENARFFTPSAQAGRSMFDLPAFIVARLTAARLGEVHDCGICTYGDDRLFSYRRMTHRGEPDYGRQMSTITLV